MKRYKQITKKVDLMREDEKGPYVKFEDVVKITNEIASLILKPMKLREEFVLEFLEKTEVS